MFDINHLSSLATEYGKNFVLEMKGPYLQVDQFLTILNRYSHTRVIRVSEINKENRCCTFSIGSDIIADLLNDSELKQDLFFDIIYKLNSLTGGYR